MKKHLHKFETTLWLFIKGIFYLSLMAIFIIVLGKENIGLTRLSRTLGITVSTFAIVGILFVSVYGKYDVGRRKSKPIIYSYSLTLICTDIITYLQLMIMRTNTQSISDFRLIGLKWVPVAFLVQMVVVTFFVYGGNWLFFKMHDPEKCCLITSSQKRLNEMVMAIQRFQKQYAIDSIWDYRAYNSRELKDAIKKADTVFLYDVPAEVRSEVMRYCYHYRKNVYFNPDIEDVMEMNAKEYLIDDMYLLNKNVKALTMEQRIAKRLLDITLSLVLGILSAPFWLGAMLAIKLEDGGPVFFVQERATIHGRTFNVYKLRSMKVNSKNYSVTKQDDRITKVGQFIRKTRIDELPQLLNVLKGDMSLVGPRPEMLKNVEAYEKKLPEFKYRLRMKAGLTGYAQIAGKYNTTPKDKLLMDMMYIEQFSIKKDIQLIFQTAIVLLKKDSTEAFGGREKQRNYVFKEWEEEV